ncbi:hypothetical protein I4U23_031221 [Adineta vaga]|nr:hypothetical protein I4U23_031221 [Adineta vaga]
MNLFQEMFIILLSLVIKSNGNNSQRSSRGAYAYSSNIEIRCFSSDSYVKLSNGLEKLIGNLEIGDQLMTINENSFEIQSTEMILMLHQSTNQISLFYNLKTKSNNEISLTANHLIPIRLSNNKIEFKLTKDIEIGDYLIINENGKVKHSQIINKTIQIKRGFYAPLTMSGTLLINNIYSSSFANIQNHYYAQFYLFPLRFYYQLSNFDFIYKYFPNLLIV